MDKTKYLSVDDVKRLHQTIADLAAENGLGGGPYGVRDEGLLDSAVNRPKAGFGEARFYPTIFDKAAALAYSLIKNHPFNNGNKRTALLTTVTFLRFNGYEFGLSPVEFKQLVHYGHAFLIGLEEIAKQPDVQELLAYRVYFEALRSFITYLTDPKDAEISWDKYLATSLRIKVRWDWESDDFAGFEIDPNQETLKSATGQFLNWAWNQLMHQGLKSMTFGSTAVEHDGAMMFGVDPIMVPYLDDLPEDEQHFVIGAVFVRAVIDENTGALTSRYDEVVEMAKYISPIFEPLKEKDERYRVHLEQLEHMRNVPGGFSLNVTVKDEDRAEEKTYDADLRVEIFPLYLKPDDDDAHFKLRAGLFFGDERPDFNEWTEEDRGGLGQELLNTVTAREEEVHQAQWGLIETLWEISSQAVNNVHDKLVAEMESPRQSIVEDGPPLDASVPFTRPMIGEVWKYIIRISGHKFEIDDIAEWLEVHTTQVEELQELDADS